MKMEKQNSNNRFSSRDKEIRATISKEEAIRLIENVYGAQYDPLCGSDGCFNVWDQLLACESVAEATPIKEYSNRENVDKTVESENVYVNGNGGSKQKVNFELTETKLQIIKKLEKCNCLTPPIKIASYLTEFFKECGSESGYWLYVSQHWNPRAINRTIASLIKQHKSGRATIGNWAAYFVYLIQKRKQRRSL